MSTVTDFMIENFEYRGHTLASRTIAELTSILFTFNLQLPKAGSLKKVYMRILYDHFISLEEDSDEVVTLKSEVGRLNALVLTQNELIKKRESRIVYLNIFTPKDLIMQPPVYVYQYCFTIFVVLSR